MKKEMLIIVLSIILVANLFIVVAAQTENDSSAAKCKNYFYYDNEHNVTCMYKQFCGAFMYYGLHTFSNMNECLKSLKGEAISECVSDSDCAQPKCGENTKCLGVSSKCINGRCEVEDIDKQEREKMKIECDNENCTKELSNGRKANIKIMPLAASAKAIERLGEIGFTITIKETGKGEEIRAVYELNGEKKVKILGFINAKEKVSAEVDSETGEVIKTKRSWWSFLASE